MKYRNDQYGQYKQSLRKLLRINGLEMMANDLEVINRIFNLLTENKSIDKIEGLISTTEITKYGGEIENSKVKQVNDEILNWWECIAH